MICDDISKNAYTSLSSSRWKYCNVTCSSLKIPRSGRHTSPVVSALVCVLARLVSIQCMDGMVKTETAVYKCEQTLVGDVSKNSPQEHECTHTEDQLSPPLHQPKHFLFRIRTRPVSAPIRARSVNQAIRLVL